MEDLGLLEPLEGGLVLGQAQGVEPVGAGGRLVEPSGLQGREGGGERVRRCQPGGWQNAICTKTRYAPQREEAQESDSHS